jgi:hypothetical protein
MDINISSRGGNYSAVNGFSPTLKKVKAFGNFADSNAKAVGVQSKKQVRSGRQGGKKHPLGYKQNLG